jgi:hypothetical protein
MAIRLHKKIIRTSLIHFFKTNLGTDLSVYCVKNFIFKKRTVFFQKGQNVPKISGTFCHFCKKIWDGLSVPKGYFVLGTFCPKDRSVAGTLLPRTFRLGTFRQGTLQST